MSRVKTDELARVRRTLWAAADELRANSTMSPAEYRGPVLGLIFLAYAEHRFEQVRPGLEAKATARRPVTADDYRARSVLFVPDAARLSGLVWLPEGENLGKAIDEAMKAVEAANPELRDVLPVAISDLRSPPSVSCSGSSLRCRTSCPVMRSG
jgi:type I restriction enzyme M protein